MGLRLFLSLVVLVLLCTLVLAVGTRVGGYHDISIVIPGGQVLEKKGCRLHVSGSCLIVESPEGREFFGSGFWLYATEE